MYYTNIYYKRYKITYMNFDSKNIVNLDLKKDDKILNFSDFQKQNIQFDIDK